MDVFHGSPVCSALGNRFKTSNQHPLQDEIVIDVFNSLLGTSSMALLHICCSVDGSRLGLLPRHIIIQILSNDAQKSHLQLFIYFKKRSLNT